MLLKKGVNTATTDEDRRTALHRASQYGYSEIAKMLFEKGVNAAAVNQH
jgi:ankyrin repeat protein